MYTRREVAKLTLAALPGIVLLPRRAFAQTKPNSVINGVHLGVITYSYRSMPDQGGEATLRYIVDSGISEIEMMNGPAEAFAGAPRRQAAAVAAVAEDAANSSHLNSKRRNRPLSAKPPNV